MKFCDVCDNMMYIRIQAQGEDGATGTTADGAGSSSAVVDGAQRPPVLMYACKSCGNRVRAAETDSKSRILHTNYSDDHTSYKKYATPHIRHDPTLPRVNNIPCPSATCSRPENAPAEVIYVKYDSANLRFMYNCCHCGVFWKSDGMRVSAEVADAQ
jgi:DNA-directed RNA polymerase subunit M/transcription elongation factor TFIIS